MIALLPSCRTGPKENYQQAFEANLSEAGLFIKTLNALDSGDVAKARKIAVIPVFIDLDGLRYSTIKGMVSWTPEQKKEWAEVAKETLDYMERHEDEWDSKRLDVQAGLRGLRQILTESNDVRRIAELSKYLAEREKTKVGLKEP